MQFHCYPSLKRWLSGIDSGGISVLGGFSALKVTADDAGTNDATTDGFSLV